MICSVFVESDVVVVVVVEKVRRVEGFVDVVVAYAM